MEPPPSTGLQKGHSQSSSGCEGHKHQLPPVLLWFGGASARQGHSQETAHALQGVRGKNLEHKFLAPGSTFSFVVK